MPAQPPPGAAEYTLSENRQRSESPRRESVEIHFPPQSESEYQDSQNGWPYPESRSANFLFLFISAMETSSPRLPDSRFSGLIGFPAGNALFLLLHFMRLFHGAWILFDYFFTIPSDFLPFVFMFSSEKLYPVYTFWSQFSRILILSTTKEVKNNLHCFSINKPETAKHFWKHVSNANLSNR